MTRLFTALVALALSTPAFAGAATRSITGCTQGDVDRHTYDLPNQLMGNYPDRVLSLEVGLAKGKYRITVVSQQDFEPFVYTRSTGDWRFAGLPRAATRQANGTYTLEYTADHFRELGDNWWLLQLKPRGQAQTAPHRMQLAVTHLSCPNQAPAVPSCSCPAGSDLVEEVEFFGMGRTDCVDRATGRVVAPICR